MKSLKHPRHLLLIGGLIILCSVFLISQSDYFQTVLATTFPSDKVLLAKVLSVQKEVQEINGEPSSWYTLRIEFLSGTIRGGQTEIHNRLSGNADPRQKVKTGETIIVAESTDFQGDQYYMADRYRLPALAFLGLIFLLAIIIVGGIRGITSLLGLVASLAILLLFVIPRILAGENPLIISFLGAVVIAIVSLYLAHGFSKRTTVALVGTLITLVVALGLTVLFTSTTNLLGLATEESFILKLNVASINLRGLLLAGIIIGMLGVLDDVTIGQAATIQEIKKANPSLRFKELYGRGITVGKEHIASVVNTLALAYVGTALPLFLLIIIQSNNVPVWLAINGEPIAEEIVRTLVGSLALVFAVPITTLIAAYSYQDER